MKEMLEFLGEVIADDAIVPQLKHFAFTDTQAHASNGVIQLTAKCAVPIVLRHRTVPALPLLLSLHDDSKLMLDGEQLVVKSKKIRTKLPTLPVSSFPISAADAPLLKVNDLFLDALARAQPFIGNDASRPWACGCYVHEGAVFATNNVTLVRTPIGDKVNYPDCIIPSATVALLLKRDIGIDRIGYTGTSITFYFKEHGAYLRSALIDGQWPNAPSKMLDEMFMGAKLRKIPETFLDAIETVKLFCTDKAYPVLRLTDDTVSTPAGDTQATVPVLKLYGAGDYRVEPLSLVAKNALCADWSKTPRVPFEGRNLRGVLLGLKL